MGAGTADTGAGASPVRQWPATDTSAAMTAMMKNVRACRTRRCPLVLRRGGCTVLYVLMRVSISLATRAYGAS
jgi:hypothetical protein